MKNRQWKCCRCPTDTTTTTTLIKIQIGNFLAVHWLGPRAFTAKDPGSIPGQELRAYKLQAAQPKKKKISYNTDKNFKHQCDTLAPPQAPSYLYPPLTTPYILPPCIHKPIKDSFQCPTWKKAAAAFWGFPGLHAGPSHPLSKEPLKRSHITSSLNSTLW